jgi:eukaryotic-like serine/threonine-protein kinase
MAHNDRNKGVNTGRISDSDFKFLVGAELFKGTSQEARDSLRSVMKAKRVSAGKRLITQGDKGDELYIIQEGSCIVSFERDGKTHEVCRLVPRDLAGEMAVLTGEKRIANVVAETDLRVWGITRESFDYVCAKHLELRQYLSEIVAYRFSGQKATANRTVAKYTIREIIGRGGWSVVYGGEHSFLNLPVAIKMLKHDMAMDTDFLDKFENEAKIIALLNHPNIVRIYDIEHLYRTVFIIMEYLEGISMKDLLDRVPHLPLPRILQFLVQTANGLLYAHQKGIVHQDIKPDNLYICPDDHLKILDFGLACHRDAEQMEWEGTIHYMSPEQIEGEPIDERTDVYSLGITAFEMVTGRIPFEYSDLSKVMDAHVEEPLPDPLKWNSDLPLPFRDFIVRATEKDPNDRFADMSEVLDYLLPLSAESGARPMGTGERRKVMNVSLAYKYEQQVELNVLLEELGRRLKDLGIEVHIGSLTRL